jgi:hypothetical protein
MKTFYSLDDFCTGNKKADEIYSEILELSSDIAEILTEKECQFNNIVCYKEEIKENTTILSYTDEAQTIFNNYHEKEIDKLYNFINKILNIHLSP